MNYKEVVNLKCPGCGAPVNTQLTNCPYCNREIIISSYGSVETLTPLELNKSLSAYKQALQDNKDNSNLNFSLAICFMKSGLYESAIPYLDKAIAVNPFCADYYFYRACATLKGKIPFLLSRKEIDEIERFIVSGIATEQKPIYYYLYAYVRYDYFYRKCFNVSPGYMELLQEAKNLGLSLKDVETFYTMLGHKRPECL